jgi:hypothetical protein
MSRLSGQTIGVKEMLVFAGQFVRDRFVFS